MKSESIIKGVSIGISTAILWSIVLNSKVVGIGVGICLGISLAISDSPISSKKDKDCKFCSNGTPILKSAVHSF